MDGSGDYSAINWILEHLGLPSVAWLANTWSARLWIILVNVWFGTPFFMIMYLATLKSVPEQLYEAAAIDGATGLQKIRYISLPLLRNIISITVLFSLIVTFANFDIVQIMTAGAPAEHDPRVRDLCVPDRHQLGQHPDGRGGEPVHLPDPRRSSRSSSCAASAGGSKEAM